MSSGQTFTIPLPTESATTSLAERIASVARPGDTFLLSGEIGTGKTTFSRAFIRSRLGPDTDVPSPTFTLVQSYDDDGVEIWHLDLYRLGDPGEVAELGLDAALGTAICLIEWPERMDDRALDKSLKLHFRPDGMGRIVTATGDTALLHRFDLADG